MNKSIVIGAILVLAAGAGYYQFAYLPAQQEAAQTAAKAKAEAEEAAAKAAEEAAAKAKAEAEEAAAKAAAGAEAAAKAAADAATQAVGTAADAAKEALSGLGALLDPGSFNAEKLGEALEATDLDDSTKMTLKTLVEAAGANPALVDTAIAQIKAALGL